MCHQIRLLFHVHFRFCRPQEQRESIVACEPASEGNCPTKFNAVAVEFVSIVVQVLAGAHPHISYALCGVLLPSPRRPRRRGQRHAATGHGNGVSPSRQRANQESLDKFVALRALLWAQP